MSLVSLMVANLMSSRMASDAGFSYMNSANQILQGVRQAGNQNIGFAGLKEAHDNENNLRANMLKSDVMRQAANAQADSTKAMLKDDIKRSFSILA